MPHPYHAIRHEKESVMDTHGFDRYLGELCCEGMPTPKGHVLYGSILGHFSGDNYKHRKQERLLRAKKRLGAAGSECGHQHQQEKTCGDKIPLHPHCISILGELLHC